MVVDEWPASPTLLFINPQDQYLHELLITYELFIGDIELCNCRNDPRACTR